jgi:hypothetical protein
VNHQFKGYLKIEFTDWYSQLMAQQLDKGLDVATIQVDLRMSTIKSLHAKWLLASVEKLSLDTSLIRKGFNQACLL